MKKILFLVVIAAFSASSIFAQKGAVKDAKRAIDSNDLNEALTLIKQAINNPETMNQAETWKVYGDIGNKAFDNERTSQMLGKKVDEKSMYDGLMNSYAPYIKADSLGELPNEKGKVKNKVRKDIQGILKANQPFYINGGVFYNEKKDYAKAADFFQAYWDIPTLPMFAEQKKDFKLDSTYQTIKYYAIITTIQSGNHARALKMLIRATKEPFVENKAYKESDLYELLASEYLQTGDSTKYETCLSEGATKFPKSKYFIPNLINTFIKKGENQKAMEYLDKAIANDPSNACDLNSVKGALLADKKQYEAAEAEYNKALAQDPNCERALEAIAVNYILQAQDLREKTAALTDRQQQVTNDKKTVELYQKSLPFLEKFRGVLEARKADANTMNGVLLKLRNVYYNLSNLGVDKSAQLKEVEDKLGTKK